MGWTSCDAWRKKSDVLKALPQELRPWVILQQKSTSWGAAVVARHPQTGETIAWVILIEGNSRQGFSIKEQDEDMGPGESQGFPVEWLDLLPPVKEDSYAAAWRARVRAHAEAHTRAQAKVASFVPGTIVTLPKGYTWQGQSGFQMKIVRKDGKSWMVQMPNGTQVKMGPKMAGMVSIVPQEA